MKHPAPILHLHSRKKGPVEDIVTIVSQSYYGMSLPLKRTAMSASRCSPFSTLHHQSITEHHQPTQTQRLHVAINIKQHYGPATKHKASHGTPSLCRRSRSCACRPCPRPILPAPTPPLPGPVALVLAHTGSHCDTPAPSFPCLLARCCPEQPVALPYQCARLMRGVPPPPRSAPGSPPSGSPAPALARLRPPPLWGAARAPE